MASEIDLCNTALSHLGARSQISAISPPDGSVEAGYCARFYPLARREVLESANFSFTKTRVELSEVTNTSEVWQYAYALPSNCLRPLRILQRQFVTNAGLLWPLGSYITEYDWRRYDDLFSERGSADFEVEGQIIRTHEPEAILLYKSDITDTTRFSPLAGSAISMVLAGYLAGPIIKGTEGAKTGAEWRQAGFDVVAKVAASDANGSSERSDFTPQHIAFR